MRNYKHKVNYYETDKMGITHHSNYVRFMEEARVDFMEQMGWGYDKMEEQGIISPVVGINCNFKNTTTYPDVIEISLAVKKISAAKLVMCYEMTSNGKTVCTAESSHCFLSKEGRPMIIERALPEFYKALTEYLIEE